MKAAKHRKGEAWSLDGRISDPPNGLVSLGVRPRRFSLALAKMMTLPAPTFISFTQQRILTQKKAPSIWVTPSNWVQQKGSFCCAHDCPLAQAIGSRVVEPVYKYMYIYIYYTHFAVGCVFSCVSVCLISLQLLETPNSPLSKTDCRNSIWLAIRLSFFRPPKWIVVFHFSFWFPLKTPLAKETTFSDRPRAGRPAPPSAPQAHGASPGSRPPAGEMRSAERSGERYSCGSKPFWDPILGFSVHPF